RRIEGLAPSTVSIGSRRPIIAAAAAGDLPLSFAQQRLWFVDRLAPGNASYNLPSAFRLRGPLSIDALTLAFDEIVRRHAVLRTIFPEAEGSPVQLILAPRNRKVPLVDLTAMS